MTGLVDYIPDDGASYIKYAPAASTKRVYGRILFANDTATTTPPSVTLTGLPVYDATDETHIFGKSYDAVLVDPTGNTTLAGIWYADIPVFDDPDYSPNGVYATLSHAAWTVPETRKVMSSYPDKVRWIDCALAADLPSTPAVARQWIGGQNIVILGVGQNPPSPPAEGVLYLRRTS